MFDTKLEQAKIQQLMNRGKDAEYDLRNQYPVIVTDPIGFTPAFNPSNVDTDYIDTVLTGNLVYTSHYTDQTPFTSTVNLHDLQSNISSTGSTAGIHEIVVETTSAENIKTYTKTNVPVFAGYLEEVPFIHPTSGSIHNFTQLDSDTAVPGPTTNNQASRPRVEITGSYLPTTTRDFTISLWLDPRSVFMAGDFIDSNDSLGTSHSAIMKINGIQSGISVAPGTRDVSYNVNNFFGPGNNTRWMHLVMTVSSAGELKVYRDGAFEFSRSFVPTHDLDLSGNFVVRSGYNSRIDSVDFINDVLPPADVLDLYNAGQGNKFLDSYFNGPTITLLGNNPMTITNLATATDPNATATDPQDGDITNDIVSDWDSIINTSTSDGNYAITYTVTDSDGNEDEVTRTVVVDTSGDIQNPFGEALEEISTTTYIGGPSLSNGILTLNTNQGAYADTSYNYTDKHTIIGWFKTTRTARASIISSIKHFGGPNGMYLLIKANSGGLTLEVRIYETSHRNVTLNSSVTDGNWHHFAITWEQGGQHNVYIDGTNIDSQTAANHSIPSAGSFWLGSFRSQGANTPYSPMALDGQIDGYYILNELLCEGQIQQIYNSGPGNVSSITPVTIPAPSLYFDGSSTKAVNSVQNVTLNGATLSTSNGKYGSDSYSFGTSGNSSMLLDDGIALNGTYTFSAWFYNKRSNNHGALVKKNAIGIAGGYYPIMTHKTDNDELGVFDGTFRSSGFSMSSYEGLQEWTHIAVVADGSKSTFYLDGQKVGNDVPYVINETVQRIGGYSDADQTFAEALDEFAYWDIALEDCEIFEIYKESKSLLNSALTNLEESRFSTLYGDASINNGILTLDDGDDDYAVYGGEFRFSDQFSVSVWFKTGAGLSDDNVIFSNHDAGQAANGNVVSIKTNGKIRVKTLDSGTGQTGDALDLGSNLNDGEFHHLVVTWQASTTLGRKIYLDGQLVWQNDTQAPNAWRTSAQSLTYIGAMWNYITNSFTTSAWFPGEIDDFRYIRKILSPTQVQQIYVQKCDLTTASDYWDGSSTSAQIGSKTLNIRGGTATATGGKYAAVFDFSGTNNACITPSSGFNFSGDATLSFWMKEPDTPKDSAEGPGDYWWQVLRSDQGSGNNYAAFMFDNRTSPYGGGAQGRIAFIRNGNQAQPFTYNISSLQDSQWHHFAFVKSGTSIDVYIDNVVIGTATGVPTGVIFDQFNGASSESTRSKFANYISDVAYWNSALESCEIQKIYISSVKLDDIE